MFFLSGDTRAATIVPPRSALPRATRAMRCRAGRTMDRTLSTLRRLAATFTRLSPGSASTDAARICPNGACQVGVRVIHPRIGLCDDDRISGRETPRRGGFLVSARGAASPVDDLAGISVRPLDREGRVVRY